MQASLNLGKVKLAIVPGKWKLKRNDEYLPSSFFTTLFNVWILNGTCFPLMGNKIALFLLST